MSPWLLHVELTNRCNASCIYCGKGRYGAQAAQDMDLDLYKRIIDLCPSVKRVHPHGFGEPLLHPHFVDAVAYARQKGKEVVVYTNGSLMVPDMAQRVLDAGISQVIFSIDAADKETYEKIRRGLSWDTLVENVEGFQRLNEAGGYNVFTAVRYTKLAENDAAQMVEFWGDKVKRVVGIQEKDIPPPDHERWSSLAPSIDCNLSQQQLTVKSSGDVVLCCNDWWGAYIFGNAARGDPMAVFRGAKFEEMRAAILEGVKYPAICDYCRRASRRGKRVVCIMAAHRREAATVETINLLRQQTVPLEIVLVGDSDVERGIAEQTGCIYVQHQNKPLSDKWQAGLVRARELHPDAILTMGSDDWVSPNWCEVALPLLGEYDVVGRNDWYNLLVEPDAAKLVRRRYPGARWDEPLCPGRLISRRALDKLDWQLWPPGLDRRLDRNVYFRLKKAGCRIGTLNERDDIELICLKGPWESLSSWEQLEDVSRGGMVASPDIVDGEQWMRGNFPEAAGALTGLRERLWPEDLLVSVCMIVRNEEDIIEKAIKSTEGLADEVVVLDTGSTDGTVALLESLGVRVLTGGDRMHKARSRNEAMAVAKGKWVVILDADERVADPVGVRKALEASDAQAFYVRLAYMSDDGSHTISYPQMRIWQRGAFEYRYRAHEVPLPSGGWGKIEKTEFIWEHRPPCARAWKSQYTLDRLLLDVKENPTAARPLFYLGRQYMYRKEWEQGVEALQKYLDMTGQHDRAEAYGCLATCLAGLGKTKEQIQALYQACAEQPKKRVWWGRLASVYHAQGEERLAVGLLKCALEFPMPEGGYTYHSWYGPHIYDLLARCYWKLKRYKEGHVWAQKAAEMAPGNKRLQVNLECFAKQQRAELGPAEYDEQHKEALRRRPSMAEVKLINSAAAEHVVGSVLDLGCGLGWMAELLDGREYVGVDFSPYAIEYAREKNLGSNARFLLGDLFALPDDLGRFDTVLLIEVLEHLKDREAAARIALRHAKERVVITVPKSLVSEGHVWPTWEPADLESLFGDLSVVQTVGNDGRYWLVVCDAR